MLWTFNFSHALDESGKPIPVSTEAVTQGIVCRPVPFPMKLTERDPARTKMVLKSWDNAKELLSKYPEGIRSTQYQKDWEEFTKNEVLV